MRPEKQRETLALLIETYGKLSGCKMVKVHARRLATYLMQSHVVNVTERGEVMNHKDPET
jgi:hypothetical protein